LAACFGKKMGLEDQHALGGASLFVPDSFEITGTLTARMMNALGSRDCEEGAVLPVAFDAYNQASTGQVSKTVAARDDQDTASLIAHTLRAEGFDAGEDGTGRGTPLVPVKVCRECGASWENGWGEWCDVCGESDVRPVPIQNATRGEGQNGLGIGGDVMFTLDTASQHGVAIPFDTTQITSAANRSNPQSGDPCHPLAAGAHPPAIAFHHNAQADQLPGPDTDTDTSASLTCSQQAAVAVPSMAVRRLTPRECERLQGFPDDYTAIPWRKKPADACPDGPRYKALGNSWAVPCAAWIGRRIQEHLG
jgi:DNA (cytosine-5)-methyltransferase 1